MTFSVIPLWGGMTFSVTPLFFNLYFLTYLSIFILTLQILEIINNYHSHTNHQHGEALLEDIKRVYYTKSFGNTIKELIRSCVLCVSKTQVNQPTLIFPVRSFRPNERWTVDYTQLEEKVWLLFLIDNFDKIVWGCAFQTKEEQNVMDLFSWIVQTFNCKPLLLQSDNGGEFVGNRLKHLLTVMSVDILHGRSYHPQSQATIERFNRTFKSSLLLFLLENDILLENIDEVNKAIQILLDRYNRRVHSSTKCRPYELHFGIRLHEIHPQICWDTYQQKTFDLKDLGTMLGEGVH
jgi:hypothetical protein